MAGKGGTGAQPAGRSQAGVGTEESVESKGMTPKFVVYNGNLNLGTFDVWEDAAAIAAKGSLIHRTMNIQLRLGKKWPCNVGRFVNGSLDLSLPKTLSEIHEEYGA